MTIVLCLVFLKEPHNILVILNVFCYNISQIVFVTLPFTKVLKYLKIYRCTCTTLSLKQAWYWSLIIHMYGYSMIIFSENDTALCSHFELLVFAIRKLRGGGG